MITLLRPGHYLNPLAPQTPTASHHRACLIRDEYDKEIIAHIKAFPFASHALANEIAGWLLHRAAGIDVAPRLWIILLTRDELTALFPAATWHAGRVWPCLASQHVDGQPFDASSADSWADELAAWPATAAGIAIAEWLWAIDDNPGNLIHRGPGELTAIDFADLLSGADWTPRRLKQQRDARFYNKRLHMAWDGLPTPAQRAAAQHAAARHPEILAACWPQIAYWWQAMLKTDKHCRAAYDFLRHRAAPGWIDTRL